MIERAVVVQSPRHVLTWADAASWSWPVHGRLQEPASESARTLHENLGPPALSRIYAGNEFCEHRLASLGPLARAARQCSLALTVLTPPLGVAGLERCLSQLRELPPGTEVVFNDWGLLQRLPSGLVPVLGRLLLRNLRDPRLGRLSGGEAPLLEDFLRSRGVRRVESDTPLDCTLAVNLRFPYTPVASGRACKVGSLAAPGPLKFRSQTACRQECRSFLCELRAPTLRRRLFQRGNTAFSVARELELGSASRVVYDPELAF